MRKISFIALLAFILLNACNSENELVEYLPADKAERVAAEHLYFSKDGYTLKLTEDEALKLGISSSDFKSINTQVMLMNQRLLSYFKELGKDEQLDFFFPEKRVIKEGLDARIIIHDDNKNFNADISTRSVVGSVTARITVNGTPGTSSGYMPSGTVKIKYTAYTSCTFGQVSGSINAGGVVKNFYGWGLSPARGEFRPGLVPGSCTVKVASTGCNATATAYFHNNLND